MIERVPAQGSRAHAPRGGCAPIGGLFEAVARGRNATVAAAWAAGVLTLDTARLYGYGTSSAASVSLSPDARATSS